jgi:hypothetical protein
MKEQNSKCGLRHDMVKREVEILEYFLGIGIWAVV